MFVTTGIGVDLVDNARFKRGMDEHGEAFLKKIFLPDEIAYARQHSDPVPSLAARFAAKEAVSKAFGCGIGATLGLHDIEIIRSESGAPSLRFHGKGIKLCEDRKIHSTFLSLSHTDSHSIAFVTLLGESPSRG